MTIIADRTNDLHQKCFVSVRLQLAIVCSSMFGVSMLGVLGLLYTVRHTDTTSLRFCTSSFTPHRKFDTRTTKISSRFLVPDFCFFRLVTSVLGLASRPGGLSPVRESDENGCLRTRTVLGSGQTTRHK
jgi:hypothetical protein